MILTCFRTNELDWPLLLRFLQDIVSAMTYLHSFNIVRNSQFAMLTFSKVHRDLKPNNIVVVSTDLDATVNLKLIDFGISAQSDDLLSTIVGTPGTPQMSLN